MTPEKNVDKGQAAPIEARDQQGREIFPADDIALVLELPGMLESEFKYPAMQERYFRKNIGNLVENLEFSYMGADDLRQRDEVALKFQLLTQDTAKSDLDDAPGNSAGLTPDKLAVRTLALVSLDFIPIWLSRVRTDR